MKKVLLFLSISLLMCGCSKEESMKIKYDSQLNSLLSANETSDYIPCDIEITYDKFVDGEVMYQVIIDNPKENMRNVNVVVTHDKNTNDGYPSIGVFDEQPVNLSVSDSSDEFNKGIVLVGYFDYDGDIEQLDVTMKVRISYVNDAIEEKEIYYVFQK